MLSEQSKWALERGEREGSWGPSFYPSLYLLVALVAAPAVSRGNIEAFVF